MPLPDLIEIVPLEKPVRADITVPGSKSITNRALVLAALADGEVTLEGALWSEDTQIMAECLQDLGFMVDVRPDPNEVCNRTITVYGKGGSVPPGGTEAQPLELFVGNAGTAARFLAAFVCLGKGVYRLHGVDRMHERPQAALFKALRELGYRVEVEQGNDKLPARFWAGDATSLRSSRGDEAPSSKSQIPSSKSQVVTRRCTVSIKESSQFASALLLCAKIGGWQIKVVDENAEESPYVAMTLKMIEAFPHRGGKFQIEPDASSGSYFLAAVSMEGAGELVERVEGNWGFAEKFALNPNVKVKHWPVSGWQADEKFIPRYISIAMHMEDFPFDPKRREVMEKKIESMVGPHWRAYLEKLKQEQIQAFGPITISRLTDLGDSIMTAIVMAPLAEYPIRFTDLGRLRVQECERVVALRTELTKCGAKVIEQGDTLDISPSKLHGAEIETYNDHRMAMCFAILGLKVPGIKIKNPACVKKTFPNFFQKLAAPPPNGLGATIRDGSGKPLGMEDLFAD